MLTEIPLLCTIIALIACIYASYTDLKSGIIQNKLTFPLIGLGVVLNSIYAYSTGNLLLIIYVLGITAAIFVLGYILWKFGAWAGGDVKLFTALAALLPFFPNIINYNFLGNQFPIIALYPYPLTVIINSILAILPFLLIFIFYIVFRKKTYLIDELLAPVKDYKKNIMLSLVITAALTLTIIINPYLPLRIIFISLILIYVFTFIISKLPNSIKVVVVTILVIFALYNNLLITIISIIILFVSITVFEVLKKILTTINRKALQDDVKINELKEGMISAYNIYEKNNEVYIDDKGMMAKIKESIQKGDISKISAPKGKLVVSNMAAGLSKKDIDHLKTLYSDNKISEAITIKKGVPFAPSIFIGLLISIFIGDLAVILQKVLLFLFT